MGRIRPRFIKRVAKEVVNKYEDELSIDYEQNKAYLEDVLVVPSLSVRNRIVGYVTTIMKKVEREKLA